MASESELLVALKDQIVRVGERREAVRKAHEALARAKAALATAEKRRDEANAAYQSALHGHAVEVTVRQPADCEDDCG